MRGPSGRLLSVSAEGWTKALTQLLPTTTKYEKDIGESRKVLKESESGGGACGWPGAGAGAAFPECGVPPLVAGGGEAVPDFWGAWTGHKATCTECSKGSLSQIKGKKRSSK